MLFDWFTIGAQALNFGILVLLMHRFLYKPVLAAIDAREQRIAAQLADADAKRDEAKHEREEFEGKNHHFEAQRVAMLAKATDEAKAERERLVGEARVAADALATKRSEALAREVRDLGAMMRRRAGQEVFAIARKALADLADADLGERIGEVFLCRLRALDAAAKARLGESLAASPEPAVVRSAFELPAAQRETIQHALDETVAAEVRVRFETAPDLVAGIELATDGQTLGWSIASYLGALEQRVGELVQRPAGKLDAVAAHGQTTASAAASPAAAVSVAR